MSLLKYFERPTRETYYWPLGREITLHVIPITVFLALNGACSVFRLLSWPMIYAAVVVPRGPTSLRYCMIYTALGYSNTGKNWSRK